MASFAPGTSQAQMEDYYRRMPRSLGGAIPDDQHPHGVPNTGRQPAGWYSTGSGQQRSRPAGQPMGDAMSYHQSTGTFRPWAPTQQSDSAARGGFAAYRPGQAQSQQSPWATSRPYSSPSGGTPTYRPTSGMDPNVANRQGGNRPPPFTATYQGFDGTQSSQPNFQQRDAFISQINSQLGQMQGRMGPPQFNFPQMWGQAGEMVRQGWQNPLAAQALPFLEPGLVRAPQAGPYA